eukprot:745690-Hanusia_phi.AAC.3
MSMSRGDDALRFAQVDLLPACQEDGGRARGNSLSDSPTAARKLSPFAQGKEITATDITPYLPPPEITFRVV